MRTFLLLAAMLMLAATCIQAQEVQPPAPSLSDSISGWKMVYSYPFMPKGYTIGGLQFPSKDTGYASVYNGKNLVLLRSIDAGKTWDSIPTPLPSGNSFFVTPLLGFCTASANGVWKTTDGGLSWQPHDRMSVANGPIAFCDNDTGFVFGNTRTAQTTDAGETWKEVFTPVGVTKKDVSFFNSKVGYVVGDKTGFPGHPEYADAGFCQKTTDGGVTWFPVYTGISHFLYSCHAVTPNVLIVGGSACIARTINGGASWEQVMNPEQIIGIGQAISFASTSHGLIVGSDGQSNGQLFSTSDTGKTWQQQLLPKNTSWLFGVQMLSDSIALICGGNSIYRTTTGGNAILSVPQHTIDFHVQTYPNPTTGLLSIQYQLPSSQAVTIAYYNMQGIQVENAALGIQPIGIHNAQFDGSLLPNGAYYFRLSTPTDYFVGHFTIQK